MRADRRSNSRLTGAFILLSGKRAKFQLDFLSFYCSKAAGWRAERALHSLFLPFALLLPAFAGLCIERVGRQLKRHRILRDAWIADGGSIAQLFEIVSTDDTNPLPVSESPFRSHLRKHHVT